MKNKLVLVLGTRYSELDAGYVMCDMRCGIPEAGDVRFDARYWMLDERYAMWDLRSLEARC